MKTTGTKNTKGAVTENPCETNDQKLCAVRKFLGTTEYAEVTKKRQRRLNNRACEWKKRDRESTRMNFNRRSGPVESDRFAFIRVDSRFHCFPSSADSASSVVPPVGCGFRPRWALGVFVVISVRQAEEKMSTFTSSVWYSQLFENTYNGGALLALPHEALADWKGGWR